MRTVRSRLSWIVGVWLACQACVLATAPLSLAGVFLHGGAQAVICTCSTAGPDHDCPMHGRHGDHAGTQPDRNVDDADCVLRSGSPASDVALVSLMGGIGLIPPAQTTSTVVVSAELILTPSEVVLARFEGPESPPPRPLYRPVDIS